MNAGHAEKLGVIGAGKLGLSLVMALDAAHVPVLVGSRDPERATSDLAQFGKQNLSVVDPKTVAEQATMIILTCADQEIIELASSISQYVRAGTVITHCSGALDSSVLVSVQNQGAHIASTHPLNTFPSLKAAVKLLSNRNHSTVIFAEGDPVALERMEPIWQLLGFNVRLIPPNAKVLYHAACVMACNHMTATIDASLNVANHANLNALEFKDALIPILQATLNNIADAGTLPSLSGPVARGDETTVSSHLAALARIDDEHHLLNIYKQLALHTLQMAEHNGLPQNEIARLKKILS